MSIMNPSARRQSSTTSLSKYARASSPDLSKRPQDFCNAFWGPSDTGVDVLFARMRGAARTVEELRAFWKERAIIEEDYAKRMSKLAKQTLGRDEIGDLRNAFDVLRLETDRQATAHMNLAMQVRTELENTVSAFAARQTQFKRIYQATIEKSFKTKQAHESHVMKAKEKYESDCMRINSYTAQSTLVQGKDLEKIQLKLDRARQTVTSNERDFANYTKVLQATIDRWEKEWRTFCDGCQDIEEERIEFMKDNVWAYANAISTVCVSDDESCEKIRLVLEQLEPERDMDNFVRDYGTGNEIQDPPQFISYTNPDATTTPRQAPRYALFQRMSQRSHSMEAVMKPPAPQEEPTDPGMAGFAAGGMGGVGANGLEKDVEAERSSTLNQSRPTSVSPANEINGIGSQGGVPSSQRPIRTVSRSPSSIAHDHIGQQHKTILQVGENAYEVDPDKDPQVPRAGTVPGSVVSNINHAPTSSVSKVGAENDPLAKQMAELRATASPIRRNSANITRSGYQSTSPAPIAGPAPVSVAGPAAGPPAGPPVMGGSLNAPSSGSSHNIFRDSAELVVGMHPSASRPQSPVATSPSMPTPPTATFMQPPATKPITVDPVEETLANYSPALPGERRRPISRSNSPSLTPSHSHSQSFGQNINQQNRTSMIDRPRSREGYAGIGSGGRSPSPSPVVVSPSNVNRSSYTGQPQSQVPDQARPANSSTGIGISLDESGRVTYDAKAEQYAQPRPPPNQPIQSPQSYGMQHQGSSINRTASIGPPPAIQQPQQPYTQPPPAGYPVNSASYYRPQQQQPQTYPSMPPQHSYGTSQPPAGYVPAPNGSGLAHRPSVNAHYPTQEQNIQNGHGFRSNHPVPNHPVANAPYVRRSPSPALPPAGYIDGQPVLFYVKALYDYQATIEEEFDFQTGDVIAVTSTPEDGWWTGVLLDDSRRIPGRIVFPSNFVCLF